MRVSDISKAVQVYSVPATRIAEELGKRMVLNSVMVGFFTAVTRLLSNPTRSARRLRIQFPRTSANSTCKRSKEDLSTEPLR